MGFFSNLIFRKKTPLLDRPKDHRIDEKKTIHRQNEGRVDAFPRRVPGTNKIEYVMRLNRENRFVEIGIIKKSENVKQSIEAFQTAINALDKPINEFAMEKTKTNTIEAIQKTAKEYGIEIDEFGMNFIRGYKPTNVFSYRNLSELPTGIEWDKVPYERKLEIGEIMQRRGLELDSIVTPDDADKDKENLIGFTKAQEKIKVNPIVEASEQSRKNGTNLDENTVLEIAKNMESELDNEDGALYSVYLKLEEQRIWRLLQTRILEYAKTIENKEVISDIYNLSEEIRKSDGCELHYVNGEFSYDMLKYIIDGIKNLNVPSYVTNIKEKDFQLASLINSHCQNMKDIKPILEFLYARMGSLGQLSCKSLHGDTGLLRDFVTNTEFKHENCTEIKDFLLLVSKVERQYIQKQFAPAIAFYNEKTQQKLTLKESLDVGFTPTVNSKNKNEKGVETQIEPQLPGE